MSETLSADNSVLTPIVFRSPGPDDAAAIYSLIKSADNLDLNSLYCYLLLSTHFSETCIVGIFENQIVGALLAYKQPQASDKLFIWQVVIARKFRGQRVASRMLEELFKRLEPTINFVEATVNPGNIASTALFESFARKRKANIEKSLLFSSNHFGEQNHEEEHLFRIGPL